MSARRFFSPVIPGVSETVQLSPDESRHALKVLRLQNGDRLQLLDGAGTLAEAEMLPPEGRQARCRVLTRKTLEPESPRWHLYVAPPRGRNFEGLLKVAVELGVFRVVPVICHFAVSRPEQAGENWTAAMIAAAKQAINPRLPELLPPQDFSAALAAAPKRGFVGAPAGTATAVGGQCGHPRPGEVAVWIGPEGGFSAEEMQALQAAGVQAVTIGRFVLRVETAVPALLAYLRAGLDFCGGMGHG